MTLSWKERLDGAIAPDLAREIDIFETDLGLKKLGRLDDRLFAEERLRRGVYGQRYDNGRRHDGIRTRAIDYPQRGLTKGVDTLWDAPGMVRIKIPLGRLSADQLDVLAEVAEEHATGILHVTTRQDVQLHFVHIEDTPTLMRRLGAVGITTQEACGNVVRNVTACARAGTCGGEALDVTPYAEATARFLLGHEDAQDFGRKMKIAFSGCRGEACGLVRFHDLGCLAVTRTTPEGDVEHGFEVYVGGGLGAVPRQAQLLEPFVEVNELLPLTQAICRVFARLGEKKNRTRARLKFLVERLGLQRFAELVHAERARLPPDVRWRLDPEHLPSSDDVPLRAPSALTEPLSGPVARFASSNVRPQRQEGYVAVTVRLPLGDLTSDQARGLAALCRRFTGDTVRASVEQNLVVRWLPAADLPAFYEGLVALSLHAAGAGTLADVTACPGTDTCKLGISASRGLAAELERRIEAMLDRLDPVARSLRIKMSGCFNSCGQHHVADIGFLGVNRNVGRRRVPHFQLVVGGAWRNNGGTYGMRVAAYPARRIPELLERLISVWLEEREPDEPFATFILRAGRARLKAELQPFTEVPAYEDDPSFYTDWGDAREYTIGDKGVGECAGELVTSTQFGLAAAERILFEGQLAMDRGEPWAAADAAYAAMLRAARTLVKIKDQDVGTGADEVVEAFRVHLHETGVFHDRYAGGKFARYLLATHASPPDGADAPQARRHIEEATLFVEAAQACFVKLQDTPAQEIEA